VAEVARVAATLSPRVSINEKGEVTFDSEPVHGAWAAAVVRYYDEGRAIDGLVRFYERLAANPSEHSREQLWNWIESQGLSVTPDGLILGYKALNNEGDVFRSIHGGVEPVFVNGEEHVGRIPQKVGDVVWMDRPLVDDDYSKDCSVGLHVGTYSYASTFGGRGSVLTEVSVDPADVVSVPEYDTNKMRVARYTVLAVHLPEVDDLTQHEAEALANDIEADPDYEGVREVVPEGWWASLKAKLSGGRKRREVVTNAPVAPSVLISDDETVEYDEGDGPDEDYWLGEDDDLDDEDYENGHYQY
jgi:hypothetical protein